MNGRDESKLAAAVAAFDQANSGDPTRIMVDGVDEPRELIQARRLSSWVQRLEPNASEVLMLAARCQHLCRWEIPRSSYAAGRTGYLRWRKDLSRFHADRAATVLRAVGYDEDTIGQVTRINLKRGLKVDSEVQTIEDALCLSFLEHELTAFAAQHPREKVVEILRKTWHKMSVRAQQVALALPLSSEQSSLIQQALGAEN